MSSKMIESQFVWPKCLGHGSESHFRHSSVPPIWAKQTFRFGYFWNTCLNPEGSERRSVHFALGVPGFGFGPASFGQGNVDRGPRKYAPPREQWVIMGI